MLVPRFKATDIHRGTEMRWTLEKGLEDGGWRALQSKSEERQPYPNLSIGSQTVKVD